MYIIQRKYLTNYYYAGSNINAEDVWTTATHLATLFRDRQSAVTMRQKVADKTRRTGTYEVKEVQVQTAYIGA